MSQNCHECITGVRAKQRKEASAIRVDLKREACHSPRGSGWSFSVRSFCASAGAPPVRTCGGANPILNTLVLIGVFRPMSQLRSITDHSLYQRASRLRCRGTRGDSATTMRSPSSAPDCHPNQKPGRRIWNRRVMRSMRPPQLAQRRVKVSPRAIIRVVAQYPRHPVLSARQAHPVGHLSAPRYRRRS
jgi:hypothetical protein